MQRNTKYIFIAFLIILALLLAGWYIHYILHGNRALTKTCIQTDSLYPAINQPDELLLPLPLQQVNDSCNVSRTDKYNRSQYRNKRDLLPDKPDTPEIQVPEIVTIIEEEEVHVDYFDTEPKFPGGDEALHEYLRRNIRYPVVSLESGHEGRVLVQFTIHTDGSIQDIFIQKGIDPYIDCEVIRLVQSMPRWSPGTIRGWKVQVKYLLPVRFELRK